MTLYVDEAIYPYRGGEVAKRKGRTALGLKRGGKCAYVSFARFIMRGTIKA